jgi:hypothetical protein
MRGPQHEVECGAVTHMYGGFCRFLASHRNPALGQVAGASVFLSISVVSSCEGFFVRKLKSTPWGILVVEYFGV